MPSKGVTPRYPGRCSVPARDYWACQTGQLCLHCDPGNRGPQWRRRAGPSVPEEHWGWQEEAERSLSTRRRAGGEQGSWLLLEGAPGLEPCERTV